MIKKFKALQFSRRYSEKYPGSDENEENEAYKLIATTDPTKMADVIRGTKYEKYYLELGPDLNIPCFGVNYKVNPLNYNKSLAKYKYSPM